MRFHTIKEWIDELKDKVSAEIQFVAENNVELQTQNAILQSKLSVLKFVVGGSTEGICRGH